MRIEHRRMNKKKQINKIMKVNNVVQRVVYDIIRWNVHNGIQGRSKLWTSKAKKNVKQNFKQNFKNMWKLRILSGSSEQNPESKQNSKQKLLKRAKRASNKFTDGI